MTEPAFSRQVRRQIERNGHLRTPGFTPMINKRVSGAIAALAERLTPRLGADKALQTAIDMVRARLLPAAKGGHRAPRPSKSDSPVYRKCPRQTVPA